MVTLQSTKLIAETVCLLAVAGAAAYTAWDLHQTQMSIRTTVSSLSGEVQSTLGLINRPCGSGGGPCGLLAEANKTLVKVQDIAVTTQKQVQQSATLVNSASSTLTTAGQSINKVADSLSKTTDAATDLTKALTLDVRTANDTIEDAQPLLEAYTSAGNSLNTLLKDEAIHRTLEDVAGMTDSGNHILFDFRKVADKETVEFLKPVPWWKAPIQKGGALIDIAAALARHTP